MVAPGTCPEINAEVKMNVNVFEICSKCGGVKLVRVPDYYDYNHFQDDVGTAAPLKGCDCPPKPKPKSELMMTIACPHCGKYVTFEVRGDIKFDFGERKEI